MSKLIAISIDVTKIDKNKLYKGAKGTYANLTMEVKDEKDQYGNDVSIWAGQTEDERKSKVQRNFLGNGKIVWESNPQQAPQQSATPPASSMPEIDDDLPF